MARNHRTEIAEVVRAYVGLTQLDFRHGDRAPGVRLGNRLAGLIEDRREHPAVLWGHERAADEVDMVLTCARLRQLWVATPDRPRDDLRAAVRQFAGDFGEEAVVADHQADLAEFRVEHWIIVTRRDPLLDLAVR